MLRTVLYITGFRVNSKRIYMKKCWYYLRWQLGRFVLRHQSLCYGFKFVILNSFTRIPWVTQFIRSLLNNNIGSGSPPCLTFYSQGNIAPAKLHFILNLCTPRQYCAYKEFKECLFTIRKTRFYSLLWSNINLSFTY